MPNQYLRLALLQMMLVFFVIFFTGLTLKARFLPLPPTAFPVLLRSYGFLLLLGPAAWCGWAIWQSQRASHDFRDEALVAVSGISLCVAILILGWLSCSAASKNPSTLLMAPSEPSATPPKSRSSKIE